MKQPGRMPSVAVIGGDRRTEILAQRLAEDGMDVCVASLKGQPKAPCLPLDEALKRKILLLPLPVSQDGETLYAPQSEDKTALADIVSRLMPGTLLLGGNIRDALKREAVLRGVRVRDYAAREGVAKANAVPTAEGALALAMEHSERTVGGSQCLIIGCGRCGRALAKLLRGCGARVTVSARKRRDSFWTRVHGCRPMKSAALAEGFAQFDYIFNTVPVRVVDAGVLRQMRKDALLIELASGASGVDMTAAAELERQAIFAPSLPGKCAPLSAAQILYRSILDILTEEYKWIDCE